MMETEDEQAIVGGRRLPTLYFGGDAYFIDNRVREFRSVTPPIRRVEFIKFDEPRGRRMLEACVWLGCSECTHRFAVSRRSTEDETWCPECRRPVIIPEAFRVARSGK